ncbi:hypothetical protein PU629_05425 [Pullulanibacillus sp. KACC 23026]|uniref:hypothetical protein n=1 Tax=Pullulanibacillus sp. KACC 23026 TaxID=3028315 RepID=UPI0023AF1844|nr:hypothetical protein [Pullulanibacillus sp. KACC 23026]WEG13808.1 hypothetical protein PU629_05425 [Pullulanibacillus sp. KACC 23026]
MSHSLLVIVTKNQDTSRKAVKKAIELAKEMPSSKLRLLYMHTLSTDSQIEAIHRSFQKELEKDSEAAFLPCLQLIENEQLSYEKYIGIGNLLHEVRIQVHLGRCGLLIMTREQLSDLQEEATNVDDKLTCPVLYVE